MLEYLSRSLLLRAGLAMGLITALAVSGMTSAVFVARSGHGEAAAVNQAGSLRMHSYRIAAALEAGGNADLDAYGDLESLAAEFEQRLRSPRLTGVVEGTSRRSIADAYQLIEDRWRGDMLPLLSAGEATGNGSSVGKPAEEIRAELRGWVFRAKSATDSDVNRPPIPAQTGR